MCPVVVCTNVGVDGVCPAVVCPVVCVLWWCVLMLVCMVRVSCSDVSCSLPTVVVPMAPYINCFHYAGQSTRRSDHQCLNSFPAVSAFTYLRGYILA